jgi:hypothetical protein
LVKMENVQIGQHVLKQQSELLVLRILVDHVNGFQVHVIHIHHVRVFHGSLMINVAKSQHNVQLMVIIVFLFHFVLKLIQLEDVELVMIQVVSKQFQHLVQQIQYVKHTQHVQMPFI